MASEANTKRAEELNALMKRCQVGHAKWGDLNDLLAECYGAIGGLRADLAAALSRAAAAEAERDRLRDGLTEAIQAVEDWAAYADDYFKEKWNLAGDLERLRAFLAAAPPAAPPTRCGVCDALLSADLPREGHTERCGGWRAPDPSPAAPPEPPTLPAEVQRVVDAARIWERFRRDPGLSPAGVLREDASRDLERAVAALRASRKEEQGG